MFLLNSFISEAEPYVAAQGAGGCLSGALTLSLSLHVLLCLCSGETKSSSFYDRDTGNHMDMEEKMHHRICAIILHLLNVLQFICVNCDN